MIREITGARYASGRRRAGPLEWGLRARTAFVRRALRSGARVLDVGAADGAMMDRLRNELGLSLAVSVEVSAALAATIPRDGVRASGIALPFAEGTFDFVVCSAARKHVRDTRALAGEFRRVLRPGGRAVIVDPHPWVLGIGLRLGKFDPRYLHHRSGAADIAAEMREEGFVNVRARSGFFVTCVAERPGEASA
jgi:SAM-dependent methyltransferase